MAIITELFISTLLGTSVALFIWAMFRYQGPAEPPLHRRVAMAMGAGGRSTIFESPLAAPLMQIALAAARRLSFPSLRSRVRVDLGASGNPNNYSVDEYLAVCLATSVAMAVGGGVVIMPIGLLNPVTFLILLGLGFGLPLMALHRAARDRLMRISKQLPYTLDLIALTMEAGSTFPEAVETMIRDDPEEDLNQELRIVQAEIELGANRAQALSNLSDRIRIQSLRSIIGAINQAEALGTPMAAILKVQSSMLRNYRSVRAEKLSASATNRILLPTMLILISVLVLMFGPMIIRMVRGDFRGVMGG